MEPDKFRKSRQAINRLCKDIDQLIEQKELEPSKEGFEEVSSRLDILRPQAEGEIQKRSVKNLGIKLKGLSTHIAKLKPKKRPASKTGPKKPKVLIEWDEKRLAQLSKPFLKKVFHNMGDDKNASVCFGTTGKGIRPSYEIRFANQETTVFTGSGHKPREKSLSKGAKNISQPFSQAVIDSILREK